MKKIFGLFIVMAMFATVPTSAQGIYFGVKGGLNNTKLAVDLDGVDSESGYGWFVGPTLKIDILPFLGVQASAFYNQSNSKVEDVKITRKSILVPLDARLNLMLSPAAGIYLSTGPQFGFNVGDDDYNIFGSNSSQAKENINNTFQLKKSMFSWNFGAGLMMSKQLELGIVYSLGISKTAEIEHLTKEDKPKTKGWMASATLFF